MRKAVAGTEAVLQVPHCNRCDRFAQNPNYPHCCVHCRDQRMNGNMGHTMSCDRRQAFMEQILRDFQKQPHGQPTAAAALLGSGSKTPTVGWKLRSYTYLMDCWSLPANIYLASSPDGSERSVQFWIGFGPRHLTVALGRRGRAEHST